MGIFGPTRPNQIREEELSFVHAELREGDNHLTEPEAQEVLSRMSGYMNSAGKFQSSHPEWKGMDAQAVEDFMAHGLQPTEYFKLTDPQKAKIHTVLKKYVDVNRTKSFI